MFILSRVPSKTERRKGVESRGGGERGERRGDKSMVYPGEERRECKENDGRGGEMDSQSVPLHPHWSLVPRLISRPWP